MAEKPTTIPEYIATLPPEQARVIKKVRTAVRDAVDRPDEKISYSIPSLRLPNGYRVYYAAWKKHVGMYPINRLPAKLEKQVAPYRATKDTLHFKWDQEIPYDLITEIAREKSK